MRRRLDLSLLCDWLGFLGPLAIYIASLSPAVAYWDTGEEQTVPTILGIAHPTGFPLFVLAGWLFAHGLPLWTPAWRIGAMSALAMAVAARNVAALVRGFEVPPLTALATAFLFAFGNVAWTRGSRAEVHALVLMFETFALLAAVRFHRRGERGAFRVLALCTGLSLATHTVSALVLPGLALIALKRWNKIDAALALQSLSILAVCAALYLYMPLRSAQVYAARMDPTLSIGIPPGRPFWDYDHTANFGGFQREIFGGDFDVADGLRAFVSPAQYVPDALNFVHLASAETGVIAFGASMIGLGFALRKEPWQACGMLLAGGFVLPFAGNYHALADIDRWYLLGYWLVCAFAAIGVTQAMVAYMNERSRLTATLSALVTGALALALLRLNAPNFGERSSVGAEPFIARVLHATPDDAIIVAYWSFSTPLAYAAYVQHQLGRRVLETQWIEDDAAYLPRWIDRYHRPVVAVADTMPRIRGFHFKPIAGSDFPLVLRVTR